jgi:hypothetical protein
MNVWRLSWNRPVRRALGYSLTGTTVEKAVFIPFGTGDNGKSTMLSTFAILSKNTAICFKWTR